MYYKASKGDQRSQYVLFRQYYPYLMSIALRYTRNEADAEEVCNDSFLRIFNHLGQYDDAYPFTAWIGRITVNASIDFLRKKKNQLQFVEINDEVLHGEQEKTFEIDDNQQLLPILQDLSPQYRTVFNLYVFEDLKHQEIAKKLGISVGTSKSNYARAKAIIKDKLSNKKAIGHLLSKII